MVCSRNDPSPTAEEHDVSVNSEATDEHRPRINFDRSRVQFQKLILFCPYSGALERRMDRVDFNLVAWSLKFASSTVPPFLANASLILGGGK
jgi:hypothetical protein